MIAEPYGYCPTCGKNVRCSTSTRIVVDLATTVAGRPAKYEETKAHCKICGGSVFVPGIADMNCYRRRKTIMEAEK